MDDETVVHLPDGREIHFPSTMSDDDITKAVSSLSPVTKTQDSKPENTLSYPAAVADHMKRGIIKIGGDVRSIIKNHPVAVGATLGAIGAVPSGGASLPIGLASAGLGAAGGGGIGGMVSEATGAPDAPHTSANALKQMGTEGVIGAAGEGVGRAAMGALRIGGRAAYRYALAPVKQTLDKFGDIVGHGLATGTPVDAKGLAQSMARKQAVQGAKTQALSIAPDINPVNVTDNARQQLASKVEELVAAGEATPGARLDGQVNKFAAQHVAPTTAKPAMRAATADAVKGTMDDRLGLTFRKIRGREPLTGREEGRRALSGAINTELQTVVPGYKEMNREIMNETGLSRAITRRTTGVGGNQGLENVATVLGGPSMLPGRIAALPPISSRLGIAAHRTGNSRVTGDTLRSAILALVAQMEGQNAQQD